MKILSITLVGLGIFLIGYSLTLEPYKNEKEYNKKYYAIDGENKTQQFHELRTTYLTAKYQLEDYGLTIFVLGIFSVILFFTGWASVRIPNSKIIISLVGLLAVIATIVGYVGDLYLEMFRGSYPHWADSIGIPLAIVPVMSLALLGWYGLNLIGLISPFKAGGFVKDFKKGSINYWYASILILTMVITIVVILDGDFWWTTAGILWIYFYLSLLIGRRDGFVAREKSENRL